MTSSDSPALRTALREYGQHKLGCGVLRRKPDIRLGIDEWGQTTAHVVYVPDPQPCTCGLAALLDAAPPSREQQDDTRPPSPREGGTT